jgi:hypothetical protein
MRRIVLAVFLVVASVAPAFADPDTQEAPANRPSGFWGSTQPALHGAYRYRLLLLGVAVALVTGLVIRRIIMKANASRATRLASARTVSDAKQPKL